MMVEVQEVVEVDTQARKSRGQKRMRLEMRFRKAYGNRVPFGDSTPLVFGRHELLPR